MNFDVEFDREEDGRWIAEIPKLPGVMAYGTTQEEAKARLKRSRSSLRKLRAKS